MKNILYISPNTSVKGGISTVIKGYLSSELPEKYNIILVSSHRDGTKFIKLIQAIAGLIQTVFYLTFKKIDIVHIHGSGDTISSRRKFCFIKVSQFFRRKVIYHFHAGFFLENYRNASKKWQNRFVAIFEGVDLVICLSESWKEQIANVAPQANIKVVHNGIRLPYFKKGNLKNRPRLTFLGLVSEKKGAFDLLEVIRRLVDNKIIIKLTIAGHGKTNRLREEVQHLALTEYVEYVGWLSEKQIDKLLRETDIFVLPSYGEGMPMSILEAMSYSVPVVSTTVGGIPELVSDGETGFLIEHGDLDALYRKLKCLIQDKELRKKLGEKARQFVASRHNLKFITQQIDQIYDSL